MESIAKKEKMSSSYKVSSTSAKTATVEDIWLDPPEDRSTAITRRILRAEIVDNAHSTEARIKACLLHQKRHSKNDEWKDVDAFKLTGMKAGEEVRLQLGSSETHHLFKELGRLHKISEGGVPQGQRRLVVADEREAVIVQGSARGVLQQLLNEAGDDVWQALKELQPDLFRAIALLKLHEIREKAVEEFETHLEANDWSESHWHQFFKENTWIFGYGLSYRFLTTIQSQPEYGGADFTGHDGQRGDFLTATEAERRFTVLVEIKKPNTDLILNKLYRNKVHMISGELAGGVTQVQSNCHTWETETSQTRANRDRLEPEKTYTIQPKGILIIGHTGQLDSSAKQTTFEMFRRNLQNPEVITFDELLARARHLLLHEANELMQHGTSNVGAR